jgi:hypothetical protein
LIRSRHTTQITEYSMTKSFEKVIKNAIIQLSVN